MNQRWSAGSDIRGPAMSLSHDIVSAFSKPHGMEDFSEHHPVLLVLGGLAVFVTVLFFACRYLLFV